MSTNISKKKRDDLLDKIKQIRAFIAAAPQDENTGNLLSYLSELEKDVNGKKYGLVFEEHREEIDEVLDTHTPVLTEDADLFIDHGVQMNFLIEGDNLASLQLLEKTHKGKIDLIYIDPPYNTGAKDFVYDDDFGGGELMNDVIKSGNIIKKIRDGKQLEEIALFARNCIFRDGPKDTLVLEILSYLKLFQPTFFEKFEDEFKKNKLLLFRESTYNRRERPVYGHCGWSRGRFYYRITTFEGRPWDARDPHKTTFMALKHAIRLSIWRKQKETPGVEKAPGVSLPQRKESGRSGRDDGELRFGVRPGHPRKAVTSISQAEALAHGLTHLHHLVFAAVLARELDWCAALQDAREDARPWGVVGIGLRSDVWVEVRRDNHRPAVLVTRVDDVVDMPHDVIGAAVRPQVVDDEEVILEEARLRLLALVERHRLDVGHDVLHAGLQRGEPEVDDPVGDCRGIERLTCAHLSPEEQPIHVIA